MPSASSLAVASDGDPRSAAAESLCREGALSVRRASEFCGLCPSQLYKMMSRSELPFVKVGKSRRIPRVALVRLLAAGLKGDPTAFVGDGAKASA